MSTWLIPREELTPEQLRAIEFDMRENRVILGGPGSGKTQILLHRAQFLRERCGVEKDGFHIFVYTNALRAYIQSALSLLDLPDGSVTTLDGWCMAFYREQIGGRTPWNKEEKKPDFPAIRKAVRKRLRSSGKRLFECVLVDEAQDLDQEAFDLILTMARHVTVCADHKQQIYDHGSEISSILKWLGVRRTNITLLETYRCCPYIVRLASELIDDAAERAAYIRQARTAQTERETPVLYRALDAEDEKRRLIDALRWRLASGERIAVLFPQQRQAYGYANAFKEAGIDVENPKELDFASDRPKLMPYPSAKGLTFDTVILPRLVPSAFGKMGPERIERILFVGITRAIRWVYLSTVADKDSLRPLERIVANSDGALTIRRHGDTSTKSSPETLKPASEDVLDLL
ncbi:MAG: UvrD-helicase domain-containing protein [Thermoguttaceae bacterium]|jgi:superfamily I DNA/RNA helicase